MQSSEAVASLGLYDVLVPPVSAPWRPVSQDSQPIPDGLTSSLWGASASLGDECWRESPGPRAEEETIVNRLAHLRVAALAADAMPAEHGTTMGRLWEGIDTGATLPDELHILWEPDEQEGVVNRVLMHRCYVDSENPRDRGCPLQIVRYATGTSNFVELYASGELEGVYDEEEFLLNAGAYLGMVAHHIADLCTPVHVGRHLDLSGTRFSSMKGFHSRVEADLDRAAKTVDTVLPYRSRPAELTHVHFEDVARRTYGESFVKLPEAYSEQSDASARVVLLAACVVNAARITADTWLAVLRSLGPEAAARLTPT